MMKLDRPINRCDVSILEALANYYCVTNEIEVIGNHVFVASEEAYNVVDSFLNYGLCEHEVKYLIRTGFLV